MSVIVKAKGDSRRLSENNVNKWLKLHTLTSWLTIR